jgi:hypothetical protein
MKNIVGFTFLFFTNLVSAQQNLFNIASGDITPKNKFFFQHQTNFYTNKLQYIESKNHLVYGLGSGWEIGMNVINIKMDYTRQNGDFFITNDTNHTQPMKPIAVLTAQKMWKIGDKFSTSIGTLSGFNVDNFGKNQRFTHFTYGLAVWHPIQKLKLVGGPYLTDGRFAGMGSNFGIQAGFEAHISKKIWLMGDFISGNSAIGVSVLGINYNVSKRIQLCLGKLLPNPNSGNPGAVVFEINVLGFDIE